MANVKMVSSVVQMVVVWTRYISVMGQSIVLRVLMRKIVKEKKQFAQDINVSMDNALMQKRGTILFLIAHQDKMRLNISTF